MAMNYYGANPFSSYMFSGTGGGYDPFSGSASFSGYGGYDPYSSYNGSYGMPMGYAGYNPYMGYMPQQQQSQGFDQGSIESIFESMFQKYFPSGAPSTPADTATPGLTTPVAETVVPTVGTTAPAASAAAPAKTFKVGKNLGTGFGKTGNFQPGTFDKMAAAGLDTGAVYDAVKAQGFGKGSSAADIRSAVGQAAEKQGFQVSMPKPKNKM